MNGSDILTARLYNTGLIGSRFRSPAVAVAHLGAVQAQDFILAKWALGLRVKDSTIADIERAFNSGEILRTHVLRPTWHFVLPEDIRWMTALTGERVKAVVAGSNRKIGLTSDVFATTTPAIVRALEGGTHRTRRELKSVLEEIGIRTDVQRLAHIIMQAELDGLICSGPKRGNQMTYALVDERVRQSKELTRNEALELLARRYFASHGPAQLKDFFWWSGLSRQDAEAGLDAIRAEMEQVKSGGRTFWSFPAVEIPAPPAPAGFLLSIYDEYLIAYKDRSDVAGERGVEQLIAMGNALTTVIVIDGRVGGTWRREVSKKSTAILLNPFHPLGRRERDAVGAAATRYGEFTGMPVVLAG